MTTFSKHHLRRIRDHLVRVQQTLVPRPTPEVLVDVADLLPIVQAELDAAEARLERGEKILEWRLSTHHAPTQNELMAFTGRRFFLKKRIAEELDRMLRERIEMQPRLTDGDHHEERQRGERRHHRCGRGVQDRMSHEPPDQDADAAGADQGVDCRSETQPRTFERNEVEEITGFHEPPPRARVRRRVNSPTRRRAGETIVPAARGVHLVCDRPRVDVIRDLQAQVEGTENRIAVARKDFIEAVQAYNTEIKTIPGRWWAALLYPEAKEMAQFQADEGAAQAPKVDFGTSTQ